VRDSSAGVNYGASDPGRMAKRWRNCRLNRLRTGLGRKRGLSDDAKEFPLGQLVELYWTLSQDWTVGSLQVIVNKCLIARRVGAELHLY